MKTIILIFAAALSGPAATHIQWTLKLHDDITPMAGKIFVAGPSGSLTTPSTTSPPIAIGAGGVVDFFLFGCQGCAYTAIYQLTNTRGTVVSTWQEKWFVPDTASVLTIPQIQGGFSAPYYTINAQQMNATGLTAGQVWAWDGAKFAATNVSGGGSMVYPGAGVPLSTGTAWGTSYAVGTGAGNLILGNDARLADARTPLSHVHLIVDITGLQTAIDGREPANANIQTHIGSTANPHIVTKTQVGLGSADNTTDAAKPISTATAAALAGKVPANSPIFTGIVSFRNNAPFERYLQFANAANTVEYFSLDSSADGSPIFNMRSMPSFRIHSGGPGNPDSFIVFANGDATLKGTLQAGTRALAQGSDSYVDPLLAGKAPLTGAGTSGSWPINSATASALAALPTACTAGSYPLGVLANGNATGCTVAGAGSGITSMTTGAADPVAACTAPSAANLILYTQTTTQDLWGCVATNTWKKVLSTTNTGTYTATGAIGTAPANPAAGSVTCYYSSVSLTQICLDASGNVFSAVKTAASRTANQFVTHVGANGIPVMAAIVSADLPAIRKTCTIENDTQSATALTDTQITGRCDVMNAATLIEVAVYGSGGTPTVLLERWRPNGGTLADLTSATLPTGASGAYACAATGAACISGIAKSAITLPSTALLAGDVIRVKTAVAGGTATWHHIVATWTVN